MSRVIVVGAGMAGLSAGYRLQAAGHDVTVLERSTVPGGSVRSERHGSYLVDTGPDAMNTSYTRALGLAHEVGLSDSIVVSSRQVNVIRGGRPIDFDGARPLSLLRSSLLSNRGRLQLAAGYLRTRRQIRDLDPYDLARYAEAGAQPAEQFAYRKFGREAADWVLDPLVRVFAGTGLRHTNAASVLGAIAVGAYDPVNLLGGLAELPAAVAARLDTRCEVTVAAVCETPRGVTVTTTDEDLSADACLLAVMYEEASDIWPALREAAPEFGQTLQPIPLISITLGYDTAVGTDAYPVLVPTSEHPDVLLGFIQQHKAPDRAPAGHTLITIYTEAFATPRYLDRSDEELTSWADGIITSWYPALKGHRDLATCTRWGRTAYVPDPGFYARTRDLRSALPRGRIHVSSALFGSGSIERAVLGGERAASHVGKCLAEREESDARPAR